MNTTLLLSAQENLTSQQLFDAAVANKEGTVSASGALVTQTGSRTGRSPKDRFIVDDDITHSTVDWGAVNRPISILQFDLLWQKAVKHIEDKEMFVSELQVGQDKQYGLPVKVVTELAWHNLFCHHMFVAKEAGNKNQEWTILNAASLKLNGEQDGVHGDGAVLINFTERRVLLCGMLYAGEMKKAMFTVLNYFLPQEGVLPMHCAANKGEEGDVALFFGLSGTGKTTLSADPNRYLIGDDEHGWSDTAVFNFEGGCYAKCINLSEEKEPVIWAALRDNAIMENVIIDESGIPDFTDTRLTQNTRAAYPRTHIEKRVEENHAGTPKSVIFLTCDLYGVLPPVSLLTTEQAAYYFLSGYTALVGSTEVGSTAGIQPTFSTCFGAPFFPRAATVYADLLVKHVEATGAQVYLINTGWTGGAYAKGGERFSIPVTRRIVSAALSGELVGADLQQYPGFDFAIPTAISGIEDTLLDPRLTWSDPAAYQQELKSLVGQFRDNFKRFSVAEGIKSAGPQI